MNITSNPWASLNVSSETVLPEATSGSSNCGARVPRANITDAVATIALVLPKTFDHLSRKPAECEMGVRLEAEDAMSSGQPCHEDIVGILVPPSGEMMSTGLPSLRCAKAR